jgi:PRTRC genetic system protein B
MNQAKFEIRTHTDGTLALREAVLIYRGAQGTAFATVHDIAVIDGEATILAGKAMTPRAAIALAKGLSKAVSHGGFIPESALYIDGDLLLWWVPPARRHIAFRSKELGADERGEVVPHPGLVFAASSRVWAVWAVKGDRRPALDTPLYQAPYFNVWQDGRICQGNVEVPQGTTAEKIDAWNAAFFGSFFTHPNVPKNLVKYRGGSTRFWRDMLDGKFATFPEKVLVPANATLQDLLAGKGNGHA